LDSVEQGERAERSLDDFIARQAEKKNGGEREREELWQESVRRYNSQREQDLRTAWYDYEMRLYRIHSGLASEHLARASRLENGDHQQEERNGHQEQARGSQA
jgi:hypothetical protein